MMKVSCNSDLLVYRPMKHIDLLLGGIIRSDEDAFISIFQNCFICAEDVIYDRLSLFRN